MTIGTIKHFKSERGFGFITDDDGYEHFFHVSAIMDKSRGAPVRGQRVSFTVGHNQRTMKLPAVGVELLDPILEPRPQSDAREMAEVAFMGRGGE